ncbi:hypothetical protein GCM10027276_44180 [Comamonas piscis]
MDYALIKNGLVENVIVADADFAALIAPDWDAVEPLASGAGIGWSWNADDGFAPPVVELPEPAVLPAVVITSMAVDEANAARAVIAPDFSSMKLPVGAAVTMDVELQYQGQRMPGFSTEFAMPMRSTDGAMRFINIAFSDGRASFTAEMKDSKRWEVTRELINSGLPEEAHMDFAGIVITAVE